jgi:hypothetical protein
MTNFQTPDREPAPQPDPMLRTGKMGGMWTWLIGLVVVGIVIATLFALNPPSSSVAVRDSAPAQISGAATPPQPAIPARRATTGMATENASGGRTIPPAAPVR